MTKPHYFYSKTAEFHELSNFLPHGFEEDGDYWPTVEHYFQAQKFPEPEHEPYRDRIRRARSPRDAKTLGRSRKMPIRKDWKVVKERIMLHALRRKFERQELRELLLSTAPSELIEASPSDYYWGCGRNKTGRNRLGVLLMQVRDEIAQCD